MKVEHIVKIEIIQQKIHKKDTLPSLDTAIP
jgi:hypothetical protein